MSPSLRERAVDELMEDLNGELYVLLGQLGHLEISLDQFGAAYERLIESRIVKISHRPTEAEGLDYFEERKAV